MPYRAPLPAVRDGPFFARSRSAARIRLPCDRSISRNRGMVACTLSRSGSPVYIPPTSGWIRRS